MVLCVGGKVSGGVPSPYSCRSIYIGEIKRAPGEETSVLDQASNNATLLIKEPYTFAFQSQN